MPRDWEAYCYGPEGAEFIIGTGSHAYCLDLLVDTLVKAHHKAHETLAAALRGSEASDLLIELQSRELRRKEQAFWRQAYGATWGVRHVTA